MVLLPTQHSWESLIHLYFYGADLPGQPEHLAALLRSWEGRFGVELWASYGTMLEFVVRTPPSSVEEAWPFAVEQFLVAPVGFMLDGSSLRDRARWIVGEEHLHLHERP